MIAIVSSSHSSAQRILSSRSEPIECEQRLIAGLRSNESAAAETLIREYSPRLLAVARRMTRSEEDAADAVQEALISAISSIHRFHEQSGLHTWLHRIVVNCCLMQLRRERRRGAVSLDALLPTFDEHGRHAEAVAPCDDRADARLEKAETRQLVRDCIERLPDDYGVVLKLRDIEEFDTEETAELLGISSGAVKTRLHRARQALRALLLPLLDGESL